jgi:hypothetical protein
MDLPIGVIEKMSTSGNQYTVRALKSFTSGLRGTTTDLR